jgi:hypothetical protein
MLRRYGKVSPRRFHKIFTQLAPCECHIEELDTWYDVNIVFDDKTSLSKLVTLECSSCGLRATFDVSSYKILAKDVVF